ncbi:MAG: hypothetical protein ACREM9_13385 [Gemmatimonadales bacterium]
MTSPRWAGVGLHQRKNTRAWLVALAVACASALPGAVAEAQDTGATSAGGFDSTMVPRSDSVRPASAGSDSLRPDSLRPDSLRPDSLRPDSAGVAPGKALPPPPRPPVDSALGSACQETGGDAPDLLMVTFRPTATAEERAAVAQEVGGTLVGPSEHTAPGSWYLRVPGRAGDRSVADRLIILSPVLEVGATRCPS